MSKDKASASKVCREAIDRAYAAGDNFTLLSALQKLAGMITKGNEDASAELVEHIDRKCHLYEGRNGAAFSTWAAKVLKFRYIDWMRQQGAERRRMQVILHGEDSQDESAGEHLDRLCLSAVPIPERFGKRELQRLRADYALKMRKEGASLIEIADMLSRGKRKPVKPSSVPAMLSRWRYREVFDEEEDW